MTSKTSISQALLALAIAYFAYALLNFSQEIPNIIKAIDRTTPHVATIVDEVALVRIEVAQVRALVDKQVPAVLMQINNTLPLIEQGLVQSELYAKQLPELWQHLTKIEIQIQSLQQDLPKVLTRVDAVVVTSDKAIHEMAMWRPHSKQYITQIEHSRDDIPQYLTRIENIITDARVIGKEASRGLVSGFLKGVIALPFDVVAGLTGIVDSKSLSAKYLTPDDITLMQEKVLDLLENDTKQEILWKNYDSGNNGKITKESKLRRKGQSCYRVAFNNHFKGRQEVLKEVMCKNDENLWQVM